jgi:lipopolysaccharide export system permease protein
MILWRYILRSHIGPFLFGTFVIIFLFLTQYMMRFLNDLTSKGIAIPTIGEFLILNVSWIIILAIPIGVLFSTLMSFGSMSAQSEVTVMKASGMGLLRMIVPVAVLGALLWGFTFWYTDNVLPDTNLRLSTMMRDIQRLKPTFAVESGRFTRQIDGFTILARTVDTNGLMTGVTIYDHSKPDRVNVVNADSGRLFFSPSLTRLVLDLYSGEVHQSRPAFPNDYRIVSFSEHQITMQADRFFYEESDVSGSSRSDREMRISDMKAIVDRSDSSAHAALTRLDSILDHHLTSSVPVSMNVDSPAKEEALVRALTVVRSTRSQIEGEAFRYTSEHHTANKYSVEIHKKYAIPFACFLFVFVGAPLGIIVRGGNFGLSAAISLLCYVLYWMTLIGGEKLADRGFLEPGVAMWMGNVIFAVIGAIATVQVNFERSPLALFFDAFRRKR